MKLSDELARVFSMWLADRMMKSKLVREVLAGYSDNYVEALTGHSAADWRMCRVRAVKIPS